MEEIDNLDRGDPDTHANVACQEDVHLGGNQTQTQESTTGAEDIIENSSEKHSVSCNPEPPKPGCSHDYRYIWFKGNC